MFLGKFCIYSDVQLSLILKQFSFFLIFTQHAKIRTIFFLPFLGQSFGCVCWVQSPLKLRLYLASLQAQHFGISAISFDSSSCDLKLLQTLFLFIFY